MEAIGLIGLGRMGSAMAQHILRAGYRLVVHDLNPGASDAIVAAGGVKCDSARAVAEQADMVLVVVGFGSEVRAVVHGAEGVWAGARPGSLLAVASTVEPGLMHELGREGESRGVGVIDTPLIRGEEAAREGKLLVLTGGDDHWLERADPVLKCFAEDVIRMGGLGSGQVGKALNNYLLWACTCANHEMFRLAEGYGLDGEAVRQALLLGSGANWSLAQWRRPRNMPWAEKDMTIVLDIADQLRVSLPVAGVIREAVKGVKLARGLPTPQPTRRST